MKYNNVLCLYPYFKESPAAMGFYPPTGLEYVAAALEDYVGEITLIDLRQEIEYHNINHLRMFINKNIDLMCVSVNWGFHFQDVCNLINYLPDDIKLIVGGQHATDHVEDLFQMCPNIDIIVRGEGEETIQEIAQDIDIKSILGISYKNNGRIIHNPNRPLPPADKLRPPNRNLRRTSYYIRSKGIILFNSRFDTVLSARGCPYNCKFCTFSLNPLGQKRKYTERSLESVIEELKSIIADVVLFSDDNFFTNPKRSVELCDLIIENGIKKTFMVQTRIEIARHDGLLEKAEKAGFKILLMGIESPHDKILKQLDKGFTQQQIREAFKILNKYNFYIHGYFIYGNIGETEEEMVYIAQFAKELKLDSITFQKLRVEKFSILKEEVENTPGYYFDSVGGPVYSDMYSLKDLRRIRDRIRSDFYNFGQIRQILKKVYTARVFSALDIMYAFAVLPKILFRLTIREFEKKGWVSAR